MKPPKPREGIYEERLRNFLEDIGAPPMKCYVCGGYEWTATTAFVAMDIVGLDHTARSTIPTGNQATFMGFACQRCGRIELFNSVVVARRE